MRRTFAMLVVCVLAVVALLLPARPGAATEAPVTVHGQVTDISGRPLGGIEVQVVRYDRLGPYPVGIGRTDPTGHYRFTFPSGETIGSGAFVAVFLPRYAYLRREVGTLAGRTYRVDLALERLPRLRGRVVDEDGRAVLGAKVSIHNTDPGGDCPGGYYSSGDDTSCVTLDRFLDSQGDGRFGVWIRSGDEFTVIARRAGYTTTAVHHVGAADRVEVVMTPGEEQVDRVTVHGVVTDAGGAPVAGVEVLAVDRDQEREDTEGVYPDIGDAITDADGVYELTFDPLALDNIEQPIHVRVRTVDSDVEWPVGEVGYYAPGSDHVVDIPIGPRATVSGTVLDADGVAMPAAVVCCGADGQSSTADDAGHYALSVDAGYGQISANGHPLSTTAFIVQPGEAGEVDVQFRRPPEGEPAPEVPEPDITSPAPPQDVHVEVLGPRRVRVGYSAAYSGGRRILRFQAACVSAGIDQRDGTRRGSIVVDELTPGRRYRCLVRGRNVLGWGEWSEPTRRFRTPGG